MSSNPLNVDAYRASLLQLQQQQQARLAALTEQVEGSLGANWQRGVAATPALYGPILDQYAQDLAALRAANDDPAATLSLDWLTSRNPQIASIEANVKASLDKYAAQSATTVTTAQASAAGLGLDDASHLTQQALWPAVDGAGVPPAMLFNRPNPDALAAWVGRAGNGHPLGDLFANFGSEATTAARQAMMLGLATGANPKAMASGIADAMGISRSRATIIARTEVLGSYRSAAHETYRANSDVLNGWVWSAGGNSPCAMCAGMDGLQFSLDEELVDHPCGKCSPIPITKTWDDILSPLGISGDDIGETSMGEDGAYESFSDRFSSLPAAQQRDIIGTKTGYEAYQRGEVTLKDFIGKRPAEDGWPAQYYQKSLREMQIPTRQGLHVTPSDYLTERLYRQPGLNTVDASRLRAARMPPWARQTPASQMVYQILRNGLPTDLPEVLDRPVLIEGLRQMLESDIPANVRAAVERQLTDLGAPLERVALNTTPGWQRDINDLYRDIIDRNYSIRAEDYFNNQALRAVFDAMPNRAPNVWNDIRAYARAHQFDRPHFYKQAIENTLNEIKRLNGEELAALANQGIYPTAVGRDLANEIADKVAVDMAGVTAESVDVAETAAADTAAQDAASLATEGATGDVAFAPLRTQGADNLGWNLLSDKQAAKQDAKLMSQLQKDAARVEKGKVDSVASALDQRLAESPAWRAYVQSRSYLNDGEQVAQNILRQWRLNASEDAAAANWQLGMQKIAAQEFSIPNAALSHIDPALLAAAGSSNEADIAALRAFERAQYDATQQWFRDQGVSTVRLYRGVSFGSPDQAAGIAFDGSAQHAAMNLAPLSSFTLSPNTALDFSRGFELSGMGGGQYQAVLAVDVPVSRILSLNATGFGSLNESEVVLLGGVNQPVAIVAWDAGQHALPQVAELQAALSDLPAAPEVAFATARAQSGFITETASYDLTPDDKIFAAQIKSQVDALDQSALTHDHALNIGAQIHDRIMSDPVVADLHDYAAEARAIATTPTTDLTDGQLAWLHAEPDALAAHGGVRVGLAQAEYQAEYQARVLTYLQEVREMGGADINLNEAADAFDARAATELRSMQDVMPKDWIEASNNLGDLNVVKNRATNSVGFYEHTYEGNGTISLSYNRNTPEGDMGVRSTALHEMMHRIEDAIPQIGQLEQQFYDYRTAGEDLVKLTNGIGQKTKLDQWLDQYLGREPQTSLHAGSFIKPDGTMGFAPNTQSYELLSMGAEALLGGVADMAYLREDEEFIHFILGLLSIVRGDAAGAVLP